MGLDGITHAGGDGSARNGGWRTLATRAWKARAQGLSPPIGGLKRRQMFPSSLPLQPLQGALSLSAGVSTPRGETPPTPISRRTLSARRADRVYQPPFLAEPPWPGPRGETPPTPISRRTLFARRADRVYQPPFLAEPPWPGPRGETPPTPISRGMPAARRVLAHMLVGE
jgi:hypothetical protein